MNLCKTFRLIVALSVMTYCRSSHANNCQIVEFLDHTEVVCVGTPGDNLEAQKPSHLARPVSGTNRWSDPVNNTVGGAPENIILTGIVAQAANEDRVRQTIDLSVTCKLDSKEIQTKFAVNIIGKDFFGNEKLSIILEGDPRVDGTAVLMGNNTVDLQKYHDVRRWEPETIKVGNIVYSVIGRETGGYTEYSPFKVVPTKLERVEYRTLDPQTGMMIFAAKNGDIHLNHQEHGSKYGCTVCHDNSGSGKIAKFGKDMAHQICRECHRKNSATTKCAGCHKK